MISRAHGNPATERKAEILVRLGGCSAWAIQSGDTKITFLSNTCPDPKKTTKATSRHTISDRYQHGSETPLKWRFAGRLMMAPLIVVFAWIVSHL